jgi:molecular chaperone GrpE
MTKEKKQPPHEQEQEQEILSEEPLSEEGERQQEEAASVEDENIDMAEFEQLKESLDENRAKAQEYLDGWQRSRAEFANYKKRILREREQVHQVMKGKVIRDYLEILDDLERALKDRPTDEEGSAWAEGIELIYQKLKAKLEAEDVRPMDPEGEQFDPNLHEALMMEETDEYESGQVIDVVEQGYWIGDRVLRPAKVRVAA